MSRIDQPHEVANQGQVIDGGESPDAAQALAAETAQRQALPLPNQFGAVRDRLFHAMLVRVAISYNRHVPLLGKRFIEFSVLITAMTLLSVMIYVHYFFDKTDSNCLAPLIDKWPRDGVLRVEVIRNLEKFNAYQDRLIGKKCLLSLKKYFFFEKNSRVVSFCTRESIYCSSKSHQLSNNICSKKYINLEESYALQKENSNSSVYDLRRVLLEGPSALPKELRSALKPFIQKKNNHWTSFLTSEDMLFSFFLTSENILKKRHIIEESNSDELDKRTSDLFGAIFKFLFDDSDASFEYVVEYSLHYGLLKLSHPYRMEHNIPFLLVRLDPEIDSCFGDWISRTLMKYFIGYEDVLMTSVKALAENETEKGYLRDMITGEHYRFVTMGSPRTSYFTALIVMLIFTFAISMLLRFSHHQIFLFIVDLLQMFELNQALVFPAAPLLTVILALVGMEAIMSEVFSDTSTAFYVILLVWIADQYDAICCHSPISKRHWLRFFYLYHYAFYAYQYRYNGQYGGLALLTSSLFILHSMIFFFHHYEMPLIVYHERLQRIITDLQHNPPQQQRETTNISATSSAFSSVDATLEMASTRALSVEVAESGNGQEDEASTSRVEISIRSRQEAPNRSLESNENISSLGRIITVNDSLLIAGERTAREIIDSVIDSVFNTTTSTSMAETYSSS
ncbi:unnamed protein product [Thelazia callipaeda]|uniref:Membralin n=1 Tax=Thelazia callipaeda TaxID=103827 RepID=A0A0N5D107_THECL|nr:unnamed protein product [Thelazia callipaeda]